MLRTRCLALAICGFLGFTLFADAQGDDIKAVLKKAIAAHGGDLLQKYNAGSSKFKGKIKILNMDADIAGETAFQKPDKLRNAFTITIMDKAIELVQVYDGKTFWMNVMGQTMEIKDEKAIKEVRESLRAEGAGFAEMLKGGYELSSVGTVKVKGKDAIGILASKKDQRDVTYFFDKKTHLLVKTEQRALDAMSGQEFTQEKFFTEFQVKQGIKVAKRVEVRKDGEDFINIEVLDVQVVEKFGDDKFAKP
jgi:hypothetical protein